MAAFTAYREYTVGERLVTLGLRQLAGATEVVATVYLDYAAGRFPETANFWVTVQTKAELRTFLQVVRSYTSSRKP